MKPFFLGISGGTCSGKTTLAHQLQSILGESRVLILSMDSYYRDQGHLDTESRGIVNFDHPSAIDIWLFQDHLIALSGGRSIECPVFDYVRHLRKGTITLCPTEIVIVEGLFVLLFASIRSILDISIYLDVAADLRRARRIQRDVLNSGIDLKLVLQTWYLKSARPMHEVFVEPTRKHADLVVSPTDSTSMKTIVDMVAALQVVD
jgi:uridine kinase